MRVKLLIAALFAFLQAVAGPSLDGLRVSFVNFYPGSDIYELEGHSALRVSDANGYDAAISYGTFDFDQPNFVYRFVKGETDYWVTESDWARFLLYYQMQGRTVVEHVIDLDSAQQHRLVELLDENLLPWNRTYRYNYVKDNCATRPLRLLERALGDSIMLPAPSGDASASGDTFREVMRHYHKNYPWYQFGIDLALGSGIDYPLSDREKAFAPVVLDTQLPGATVGGKPLTSGMEVIFTGIDATAGPTPWYLTPMAVALFLLAVSIGLSIRDIRRLKTTRWFDTVLYGIYGLAGLVLTFLIFVSTHEATSPNWLYLWLNPLCLIVPVFIWLKKCNVFVFSYQIVNFALLIVLSVLWPFTGQSGNAAFVPLIACDALRAITYIYVSIKKKKNGSAR